MAISAATIATATIETATILGPLGHTASVTCSARSTITFTATALTPTAHLTASSTTIYSTAILAAPIVNVCFTSTTR